MTADLWHRVDYRPTIAERGSARWEYIIWPAGRGSGLGELIGAFPTPTEAYAEAIKRAPGTIPYIYARGDFPRKMFGPDDTRGFELEPKEVAA
jgi:hypothetical protein